MPTHNVPVVLLIALIVAGAPGESLAAPQPARAGWVCGNGVCDPDEGRKLCPEDCNRIQKIASRLRGRTSTGFSPTPSEQPGDYALSVLHEGVARTYKVHVPPSYDPARPAPVVMYIHGGGGNARAAYLDGMGKASDEFGFILVAPEATGTRLHTRWNGGRWAGGECCGTADDTGFIARMLEDLSTHWTVDARRIYATGISNGGLMTNRIACELSDRVAAVATVAPAAVLQSCAPARAIPVMDIHGTGDPCNPYDGSSPSNVCGRAGYKRMAPHEVIAAWRAIHGCSAEAAPAYQRGDVTCVSYRRCRKETEITFCEVKGMGHVWPSGLQYLPARTVGPVSYDISFAQIWEFFQRHPLE